MELKPGDRVRWNDYPSPTIAIPMEGRIVRIEGERILVEITGWYRQGDMVWLDIEQVKFNKL